MSQTFRFSSRERLVTSAVMILGGFGVGFVAGSSALRALQQARQALESSGYPMGALMAPSNINRLILSVQEDCLNGSINQRIAQSQKSLDFWKAV